MSSDHLTLRMPTGSSTKATDSNHNHGLGFFMDEEYKNKTLKEKFHLAYHAPSPLVRKFSSLAGSAYFWFISVSELYILVRFAIPFMFADYSDMAVYYIKVGSWWIFLQTIANWLCTRFFDTSLRATDDNPDPIDPEESKDNNPQQTNSSEKYEVPQEFCSKCDLEQPYRTHHCPICDHCILKRDHHCYFVGICIGYFNQRFFIMLVFYIIWASVWGLYVISHYMKHHFNPRSNWDYFLPVTCWNWFFGDYIEHQVLIGMFQMWTLWWTGLAAIGFFFWHMCYVVPRGITTHEATSRHKMNVRCTGSKSENFRSVFGPFWPLNFFLPAVLLYRQDGDGKSWSNIKIIRFVKKGAMSHSK